jgi:sugar lactone lactonase YvrE
MKPEHIVSSQNIVGEGPLWNAQEKAIYWVDIDGKKIQRFFPDTQKYDVFDMPIKICLMAFRSKGGMILGAENGFYFWDTTHQNLEFISHPEAGKTEARFNDGKVDRMGRLWAGTMTYQGASSSLYRMDSDLSVHQMETGLTISNGTGWSPDNKTMYFVDSFRYVVYAYDFNFKEGTISNRRPFVQENESFGVPDGLTVDSEGCVWLAVYGGWKVMRYAPDGKILDEIKFPVAKPSSCIFGGENLDELYVTTISENLTAEEKAAQPLAGDLFVIKTDVKGLPEPDFAG